MEQKKPWEDSLYSNFIYFKSKKELIDYIRFNDMHYFLIDNKNNTEPISNFSYIDISKTLYINAEFYKENKQELDKYFIQNLVFASNIMMSKYLYSEDLIKKMLCVEMIVFDDGIDVSEEIIEILSGKNVRLFIKNGEEIVDLIPKEVLGTHK